MKHLREWMGTHSCPKSDFLLKAGEKRVKKLMKKFDKK
jgi:hypothetical protein